MGVSNLLTPADSLHAVDGCQILDELLRSGKEIAEKGGSMAEQRLNIPEAGPERDAMLRGLGKGAAAAGALALLVGRRTGTGRKNSRVGVVQRTKTSSAGWLIHLRQNLEVA